MLRAFQKTDAQVDGVGVGIVSGGLRVPSLQAGREVLLCFTFLLQGLSPFCALDQGIPKLYCLQTGGGSQVRESSGQGAWESQGAWGGVHSARRRWQVAATWAVSPWQRRPQREPCPQGQQHSPQKASSMGWTRPPWQDTWQSAVWGCPAFLGIGWSLCSAGWCASSLALRAWCGWSCWKIPASGLPSGRGWPCCTHLAGLAEECLDVAWQVLEQEAAGAQDCTVVQLRLQGCQVVQTLLEISKKKGISIRKMSNGLMQVIYKKKDIECKLKTK